MTLVDQQFAAMGTHGGSAHISARAASSERPFVSNPTGIVPTEFKVLILPKEVEQVSKGGIILSSQSVEAEKSATTEGEIIAISHLAFTYATEAEWDGKKPKPGDKVLFAKYAGFRHKAKDGKEYLLVNDKDLVAVIE